MIDSPAGPAATAAAAAAARKLVIPQFGYYDPTHTTHKQGYTRINPNTAKHFTHTIPPLSDALIYFPSLFLREFVSTVCVLVLNSRLGGDLFIASPLVSLYVNIVFRRPLNSPYVLTLGCLSAGDWRRANVAGYPGFSKEKTQWWELALFWLMMLTAELTGAAAAAGIRAHNDLVLGHEFVKGAAWGTGQLFLRANLEAPESCWDRAYFPNGTSKVDIPARLYRDATRDMFKNAACAADTQWRWWFAEELGAVLFIIVAYVHIWRWLRWDDMERSNPTDREERYWEKIVTFSTATASVGLMTAMAFPTANQGMHTSVFLGVYQSLNADKNVTSISLNEPFIRSFGGTVGCLLAIAYEWGLAWLERKERGQCRLADAVHKMLYNGPIPEKTAAAAK
jgi:hypothetical protein